MRRTSPGFTTVSTLVLLSALPWAAEAQEVILAGTVREHETGVRIPDARIEVLDRLSRQLAVRYTDSEGAFRVELERREGYRIRASRLGYRNTTTPVLWTDGYDTYQLEITLDPDAVLLAPLEVVTRSRPTESPVLGNFRDRRRSGIGHFFTQADIERRNPGLVSDLLATVPGVHLESSGRGTRRAIYMSRGTRPCQALIFLDGSLFNRASLQTGMDMGFRLDDAVSPLSVVGIEVYSGLSTVPAEFLTPESDCGVIAIWTRRGDSAPGPRAAPPDTAPRPVD